MSVGSSDVTEQILSEHYNPLYSPLSPSYDELTAYADDLEYWGNKISFECSIPTLTLEQVSMSEQLRLFDSKPKPAAGANAPQSSCDDDLRYALREEPRRASLVLANIKGKLYNAF